MGNALSFFLKQKYTNKMFLLYCLFLICLIDLCFAQQVKFFPKYSGSFRAKLSSFGSNPVFFNGTVGAGHSKLQGYYFESDLTLLLTKLDNSGTIQQKKVSRYVDMTTFLLDSTNVNRPCSFPLNGLYQLNITLFDWSVNSWLNDSSVIVEKQANGFITQKFKGVWPVSDLVQFNQVYSGPVAFTMLLTPNGDVVQFNGTTNSGTQSFTFDFDTFAADSEKNVPTNFYAMPPKNCYKSEFLCPMQDYFKTLDFYRTHDNDTHRHELVDENVADPVGEMCFFCTLRSHPYTSWFQATISTRWNLYQNCNRGFCDSVAPYPNDDSSYGSRQGVGRESCIRSHNAGYSQCDSEESINPYGYWFSFPSEGRCPPNQQLGYQGCSWLSKYTIVKTVETSCLRTNVTCPNGTNYNEVKEQMIKNMKSCPDVDALLVKKH